MKYKILVCLFFLIISVFLRVYAITLATEKNGIVDIEKVFDEYHKTKDYKNDIENKKDQFKKSLIYKQKKIVILIDHYNIIVSSINVLNKKNDTKSAEIPKIDKTSDFSFLITPEKSVQIHEDKNEAQDLLQEELDKLIGKTEEELENSDNLDKMIQEKDKLKSGIDTLKEDFFKYKDKTKYEIENLEKDYLYSILDEIYVKISFIAQKYGYSVIFDKKDLVFSEKYYDLTDLIISEINLN